MISITGMENFRLEENLQLILTDMHQTHLLPHQLPSNLTTWSVFDFTNSTTLRKLTETGLGLSSKSDFESGIRIDEGQLVQTDHTSMPKMSSSIYHIILSCRGIQGISSILADTRPPGPAGLWLQRQEESYVFVFIWAAYHHLSSIQTLFTRFHKLFEAANCNLTPNLPDATKTL